jgi:hypothetical protein
MSRALALSALLAPVAIAVLACSGDPVHDNEVTALGAEPTGSPGPEHRPGQPCLVCHGGSGPASTTYAAGGTVYKSQTGTPSPLSGGTVSFVDSTGATVTATTNGAGNFYVPQSYAPTFPLHVAVSYGGLTSTMATHIGRDASCATCHYDPVGRGTPGHVYLVVDPGDFPEGGAP